MSKSTENAFEIECHNGEAHPFDSHDGRLMHYFILGSLGLVEGEDEESFSFTKSHAVMPDSIYLHK